MVHNENDEEEEEEDDDDWLYELLAELAEADDSEDEEVEEEPEKEVDDEVVEEDTKGETFFIATIFCGNEVKETEIPVKCEDPGPCLKSKEVFTTADASIVLVAGIAENVMVNMGKLTIPADFHRLGRKVLIIFKLALRKSPSIEEEEKESPFELGEEERKEEEEARRR
ncbi:hypothetical protein PIB30_084537 [Stylosanthes scabra]|uniref:Uncharacterized protein n=1 Tax=Stylosanthes scabra TaxID=79078 RepID=A0ABU6YRT5_9FABA|nr:hypothetical protein [Stylosanthes scabra]